MKNMYQLARESGISSIFPYSLVFPHYEALGQLRVELQLLILIVTLVTLFLSIFVYFSMKKVLLVFAHLLSILSATFAGLYLFHGLTINMANSLWFYFMPTIYIDAILHSTFDVRKSKWIYNRVIFSLIFSLILFSFLPIESYLYEIIYSSLLYQSVLCLIAINLSIPSWFYILDSIKTKKNNEEKRASSVEKEEQKTEFIDGKMSIVVD